MKKFIVLTTMAVFAIGALAIGAFAADDPIAQPIAQVRIVNKSAVTDMTFNDKGLMTLANLDVAKNTKIFPIVANFSIIESGKEYTAGTDIPCEVVCPVVISSTIKAEEELDFTTVKDVTAVDISKKDPVTKEFNMAVVKMDGTVNRLNEATDIDYTKKTLKTEKPIPLAEGDTILVFVSDVPKVYFDFQGLRETQSFVPY